jgi:hypothetical protein
VAIDLDGDGNADIVQQTTTVMVDVDGDGTVDLIEQTETTGVDTTGDGVLDEVEIRTITADLTPDELTAPEGAEADNGC